MKKLKVEVAQDDIDKGVRCDVGKCPVAKAVRRSSRRARLHGRVYVSFSEIVVGKLSSRPVAKRARTFMQFFDIGEQVKPFSFTLELR